MITIRKGVFETNSSSTHAIVVASGNTKPLSKIIFRIDAYGWQKSLLASPEQKASYFYTAACDCLGRDVSSEIEELLKPYDIECEFETPRFEAYGKSLYLDNGGVDHSEDCKDFILSMLNDAGELLDFIFNSDSFVETGNDNNTDASPFEYPRPKGEYHEYYKGN